MTSVEDIILIVVIIFSLGIITTLSVFVGHTVNTALLNNTIIQNNTYATQVIQSSDTAINYSDYIYLAIFIGFFLSIIIFGWLVGGNPLLSPIYFFLVIFFTMIAGILQYVWLEFASTSAFLTTISVLPITNYIMSNLGYFTALFGIVGIVILYAKPPENSVY